MNGNRVGIRPEATFRIGAPGEALSYEEAIRLISRAVARRRVLIHGKLKDGHGRYCAMGAFWADNPGRCIQTIILEEVAAVNDSVSEEATLRQRWKVVNRWLKLKMRLASEAK